MQEKSRASLTTGDTAVFTMAADISCVTCWSRWRITSSVIGSGRMRDLDHEAARPVDARAVAALDENRRVAPLDERRAGEPHAGRERFAVVDGDPHARLAA